MATKRRRYLSNTVPMDNTRVVMPFIDPNPPKVEQFVPKPYTDEVYYRNAEIAAAQGFPTYRYADSIADRRLQELLFMRDNKRRFKPYQIEDAERDYEMWKAISIGVQPSKWSLKPRRR